MTLRPVKPPWQRFKFSYAFTQAGIKYYVWNSVGNLPNDSRCVEYVAKADFFWGLVD